MSGNAIRIKRKSPVLAAKDVQVVGRAESAAGEPSGATPRRVVFTGAKTARVKTSAEEDPNTMKIDMEDGSPNPVELTKSKTAIDPEVQAPEVDRLTTEDVTALRHESQEIIFKFYCYRCGQKLKVPVSWANRMYPCIRCRHDILIPPPLVGEVW